MTDLVADVADFSDGCGFANYQCPETGVWSWDRAGYDNPHGHELPAYWIR
jgi:hypothetical protein